MKEFLWKRGLICGLVCVLVLGGIALWPQAAVRAEPRYLSIGTTEDLDSLNPLVAYERASWETFLLVYDSLVSFDRNLDPQPSLAQSWDLSEDSLTWTFHLRPGVKWHDGQPFTARDVKFTYDLILESGLGFSTAFLDGITSVEIPDDLTVVIQTAEPKANLLQNPTPILPEHQWKTVSPSDLEMFANNNPIGTGPFKFGEWKKSERLRLEVNQDYFRGPPKMDGVFFLIYANRDTMAQSLKVGEIDVAMNLFPNQLKSLEGEPGVWLHKFQDNGFTQLAFNCWTDPLSMGNPVLQDKRVRQAVEWAIDKQQIVDLAMEGQGTPGTTLIPPATPFWHYQPTAAELRTYDPARANALLDAANCLDINADKMREDPQGQPLVLRFLLRSDNTQEVKAGQMIKAFLRTVGLDTALETVDDGTLNDRIFINADFDMFIWGWAGDVDPSTMLNVLTGAQIGGTNDCYYSNPAYDAIVQAQATFLDPSTRQDAVWEAQKIIYEDIPYLILSYDTTVQAVRRDLVEGIQPVVRTGPLFYANTAENYLSAAPFGTTPATPTPTASPSVTTFPDLMGHWSSVAVTKLVDLGFVTGYQDGSFRPDAAITRAELVTILVRMKKLTAPTTTVTGFSDVNGHWAADSIEAAVAAGIVTGYPDGSFQPDRQVTRAEEATMLVRIEKLAEAQPSSPSFVDVATGYWGFGFIEQAKEQGLITGYPDGSFRPDQTSTRGEACTMISRLPGL
jgi:peptide/nickel transport system substrate-binding protein